jgi:hypothetical protein
VVQTYLPAWCERRSGPMPDGRYVVACYFTRDGHPVSKARAERVELIEYAPDGTPLRVQEGIVEDGSPHDEDLVFTSGNFRFSH